MSVRRVIVLTAAAAALFTLVPLAGVAAAATPPAQSTSSFCQHVPANGPFTDVPPGLHERNIVCLAWAGIAAGTTSTTFSPDNAVTRAQMASFVARTIDAANGLVTPGTHLTALPAYSGTNQFDDVSSSDPHVANINRLAAAGIVQGMGGSSFGPTALVTRAQMASFINRAQQFLTGAAFSTTSDFFIDDKGSVHEPNINAIASVGIAQGVGPDTYAPAASVTRAQMASFLVRWLAVEADAGLITPLHGTPPHLTTTTSSDLDGNGVLNVGDHIVLTFADPVLASSSLSLRDADGSRVTLTDATPVPSGATPASFGRSNANKTLTVTPTAPVVAPGGNAVLNGTMTITGATGITDQATGEPWDPAADTGAPLTFDYAAAQARSGRITFVDTANKTYRFVASGATAEISVVYKAGDAFLVDGVSATLTQFESNINVDDDIRFVDDVSAANHDQHELTNRTPPTTTSGTVGNIDTAANTFVLIDPSSGSTLSSAINYDGALFKVAGLSTSQSTFEAAISEGDTITITDPATGPTTYALVNSTISGIISSVSTGTKLVKIGALGDDPTGPQDDSYSYALATSTFTVDGAAATMASFESSVNTGDRLTYARDGGTQTFALINLGPPPVTGTVTETHSAANNTVTIASEANRLMIDYVPTQTFKLNGAVVSEATFEAAVTVGDGLVSTPDDPTTVANERTIALTDAVPNPSASGVVRDIRTGTHTYDIRNSAGGNIYDDLSYIGLPADFGGHPPLYFVRAPGGAEAPVTLVQYEQYLTKIQNAANPVADLKVIGTATATEHHLTTDQTIP
jgi:hypothetical protein